MHGATLEGVSIPAPVFALAIEPVSSAKQQALEDALIILQREDPSLRVDTNVESGQLMLRGVGELHLEIICDKLRRAYNVEVETGQAYVAYREGIETTEAVAVDTVYDRQVGGRRLFAAMRLRLDPVLSTVSPSTTHNAAHYSAPVITLSDTVEATLNSEERLSLIGGLTDACQRGPVSGYPTAGFNVHVEAVEKDAKTTTPGALRACSVAALAAAMKDAGAVLLEPVMKVEVLAPESSFGTVLSDLTVARRGAVRDVDGRGGDGEDEEGSRNKTAGIVAGGKHAIHADVPLMALLGYATALRSITQGEGSFTMEFSHYAPSSSPPPSG